VSRKCFKVSLEKYASEYYKCKSFSVSDDVIQIHLNIALKVIISIYIYSRSFSSQLVNGPNNILVFGGIMRILMNTTFKLIIIHKTLFSWLFMYAPSKLERQMTNTLA
jgi:hypothetical protein